MDNGFKSKYVRRLAPGGLAAVIGKSTGLSTNLARSIVVPQLLDRFGIYLIGTESSTADSATFTVTVPLAASIVATETGNDTSTVNLTVSNNTSFAVTETGTADSMSLALGAVVSSNFALTEPSTADTGTFTAQAVIGISMSPTESATADTASIELSGLISMSFALMDTGSDTATILLALENSRTIYFEISETYVEDTFTADLSVVDNTNMSFDLVEEPGDDSISMNLEAIVFVSVDLIEPVDGDIAEMSALVLINMTMETVEDSFDTMDVFIQRHLSKQMTVTPTSKTTPDLVSIRQIPSLALEASISTFNAPYRPVPKFGD